MQVASRPKQLNMKPAKTVEKRNDPLYNKSMLEMSVLLLPSQIGANGKTKENIRDTIEYYIGGKCIIEGYVKPNSIQIQQYTNGIVKLDKVEFLVVFECLVCNPVEGMWLNDCKVKSVTKAGIHANKHDEQNNLPVTVFIIRDHFVDNPRFLKIKEEDIIDVKVLGQRFELNNQCIEVIGEIVGDKSN
jgi:hypothetical protein